MTFVRYEDFGAKGDGVTNDIDAIRAAHLYANEHRLPVRATEGKTYYISEVNESVPVRTDCDFTGASVIFDDREVPLEKRSIHIFSVLPDEEEYEGALSAIPARFQAKLDMTLPARSIVVLTQVGAPAFVRKGVNANRGVDRFDLLLVERDGTIDPQSPILAEYTEIPSVRIRSAEDTPITIRGGTFTTLVRGDIAESNYYYRGFDITRSNVTVEDVTHYNVGDDERGAPYTAFIDACLCAHLTIRRCTFTPHITYRMRRDTPPLTKGTYDCTPEKVIHLLFEDCTQTVDICDSRYWGVMGSNHCRDVVVKNCNFSRFDTHTGAYDITIVGCTLGHQCLSVTGWGRLLLQDTTLYGRALVNLRPDFGANWEGDAEIRDCTWIPRCGRAFSEICPIIGGRNDQDHNFGYPCRMPRVLRIDGLHIDDSRAGGEGGIAFFGDLNPACVGDDYEPVVPYAPTEDVYVRNLTTATGRMPRLSENPYMFRGTRFHT